MLSIDLHVYRQNRTTVLKYANRVTNALEDDWLLNPNTGVFAVIFRHF